LDDDGLPFDEVGAWAKEKHERLRKYIDASRAARRKFTEGPGGSTYIDLFSGAGRAIIRDTRELIDGSPLVAYETAKAGGAPFSNIYLADIEAEKASAALKRLQSVGGDAATFVGTAEKTVTEIVGRLNPYGLHFAFLDPFNLDALPFSVIECLSQIKRVDLLVHVSVQDLQRNLERYLAEENGPLDRFAPGWRTMVDLRQSQPAVRAGIITHWSNSLERLGLPRANHAELVAGTTKNQRLYWLMFASRSDFAKRLWEDISGKRLL
jgi:three-Cys-motif partner protein